MNEHYVREDEDREVIDTLEQAQTYWNGYDHGVEDVSGGLFYSGFIAGCAMIGIAWVLTAVWS
jgi:hypothetical protein